MDQPEEAYPLVRMPAQVVAAVRARNKGVRDEVLRDEFYRVQKDVFFLFHLHKQVNLRVLQEEETYRLRIGLLSEMLRALIYAVYATDRDRLESFQFPEDLSRPLPRRKKTEQELALEEQILEWPREEALLWGEVTSFQEAERLVSKRYLSGEPLLYPDSAQRLAATLAALAGLRETYDSVVDSRPPEADVDFVRWLARDRSVNEAVSASSPMPADQVRPSTKATALALAKHFILMARAEALDDLGERDAGISLVQAWLQSNEPKR